MEKYIKQESKETRKDIYNKKKKTLEKVCNNCIMCSIERCNDCTTGRTLRYLEIEYSDVTGWSHEYWWGKT